MATQRYQQRPVIVEAIQFTGSNQDEITAWAKDTKFINGQLFIYSAVIVQPGEWVIIGVCGNTSKFGTCFTDAYDPIATGRKKK